MEQGTGTGNREQGTKGAQNNRNGGQRVPETGQMEPEGGQRVAQTAQMETEGGKKGVLGHQGRAKTEPE